MYIEIQKDPRTLRLIGRFEIDDAELAHIRYTQFDRLLLKECEESILASDKFLALELMARKIEASEASK